MKKLAILVCTHKASNSIREDGPYVPIQVGKALHPDLNLGYICDNEGDNISEKNASWNELTGLYWAWKNLKDTQYVGLCHYRRYFDVDLNDENIDKYLGQNADILVVDVLYTKNRDSNFDKLAIASSTEDAWIYFDTLLTLHPEYTDEIKRYFFDCHLFFRFNMFVMSKTLMDEYCEFLMPILSAVEKRIKVKPYSRQNRAIGYMGEWTLGLFIMCKKLKYKELPWMCPAGENMSHTKPDSVLPLRKRIKRALKFYFEKHRSHKSVFVEIPDDVLGGLAADGIYLNQIK